MVKRRFNVGVTSRRIRSAYGPEEGRNWYGAFKDWHKENRMPRGPMSSSLSHIFARGCAVRDGVRDAGDGPQTGLGMSAWVTVAHSPDHRLRPPPRAARGPDGVDEASRWVRLRLVLQNVVTACSSTSTGKAAALPAGSTRWALVPTLVSALGVQLRLKDGSTVKCLPLAGPAVVALNGESLQPKARGAGAPSPALPKPAGSPVAEDAGGSTAGGAAAVALAPRVEASLGHACIGIGCGCSTSRGGAAKALGMMDWQLMDMDFAAGRSVKPTAPVASVVLGAEHFAVLDLWAQFPPDVNFEPEALERCVCLEVPVRRGDGVGQAVTVRAQFLGERDLWRIYEYLPGGGLCLKLSS